MDARNLAVDVLRVLSVALVVLSHYGLLGGGVSGTHGVVIFFMISGYCMRYSTQGRTGGEFLKARFWRLVPTFVVCVTLTAAVEALNFLPERSQSVKSYFANLACLPLGNLLCDAASMAAQGSPIAYSWVDGAYWSLLVEIRFYLLLWLLFYALKVKRTEIAVSLLGLLAAGNMQFGLVSKGQDFLIYLPFFAFGMAYRAYRGGDPYAVWGLAFAALVSIYNAAENTSGLSMNLSADNILGYALCHVIFVVAIMTIKKGAIPAINYLGVLSYPLYLVHQDLGLIGIEVFKPVIGQLAAALLMVASAVAVAVVAQCMAVWLTMVLRRKWPFRGAR